MSSSTSASDLPGCAAISARRYSSASYSASWMSAMSSPASAIRSWRRYSSTDLGALLVIGSSGFDEAVHELARITPDSAPAAEHGAAFVGDPVVTARWTRIRRHDAAAQQTVCRERAQYGVNRAFLEEQLAFVGSLKTFDDVVAIEVFFTSL